MTTDISPVENAKRIAAAQAATYVTTGMKVGLGTGSTAAWLVRILGERVRGEGLDIMAVPTSERTAQQAREEGINVVTLDQAGWLDLTIDGTDEYDPALNLIKGGGGAHLREKLVAKASDRMIVIADASKQVPQLGGFPLPVEVLAFGLEATRKLIAQVLETMEVGGTEIALRGGTESPYVTDEGNHIFDLHLKSIGDPSALSLALNQIPGVVENGLFINMCDLVILGYQDGRVTLHDVANGEYPVPQQGKPDNIFTEVAD